MPVVDTRAHARQSCRALIPAGGNQGVTSAVMARQAGFWDYEEHMARLTKGGDPLVTLVEAVD